MAVLTAPLNKVKNLTLAKHTFVKFVHIDL